VIFLIITTSIREQREELFKDLPALERANKIAKLEKSDTKIDKMRTRLKVYFDALKLEQSMDALGYMYERHGDQIRKGGEQYVIHPMSMACRLQSLEIPDDKLFATILLHDVIEDSAPAGRTLLNSDVMKALETLPFDKTVRAAVRLMTISAAYPNEPKSEMKLRYFQQFIDEDKLENKIALKCKGFDRWDNNATMIALPPEAIRKNVLETSILLLPVMKKAKTKWPRESNILYLLRTSIKETNNILAYYNDVTNLNDFEELKRLLDGKNAAAKP